MRERISLTSMEAGFFHVSEGKERDWMKKWYGWLLTLLLVMTMGLAGCSQAPQPQAEHGGKQGAYPITLKDASGQSVTIKREPQRIVSLVPSTTETAFALGLDKKIVGVSSLDNYPAEAAKKEKVGDLKINVEKVVSLKPDLVLANPINGQDNIGQLRKLGLTVLVVDGQSLKGVEDSILLVGKATGAVDKARQLVAKMEQEKNEVTKKVASIPADKRVKVWIELDPTLFTAGSGTFMDELIRLAGGNNVATSQKGWPQVSAEQVVKWNPDVIIATYDTGGNKVASQIASRSGWAGINAVKQKRIVTVNPDLVNRPGPRVTQGLKQIAQALYPQVFGAKQ
jgi:iron complex transport system substrate-binding protein